MRKNFLLTGLFVIMSVMLSAQVTIGLNEAPQKFSVLELISGANKGLRLPQMNTAQRNAMQVSSDFQTEKTDKAVGLVIFNTEAGCEEIWNGTEWKSLCGNHGKADFTVSDCSKIMVNGAYYNGTPFTSGNYLIIPVNVTKTGTYQISVIPNSANGYYFTVSGEFFSTGTIEVAVPGQGSPVDYTPAGQPGNELIITLNGVELNCPNKPRIVIGDATIRPKYGIACASTTVSGVVKKNIALNNGNKITLRINVQAGSQGAQYSVHTDLIDGIQYKGNGTLGAAGSQEITLWGEGTTSNTALKEFTITTNSESTTATCKVSVQPVISAKRIVEFAENQGRNYGLSSGNETYGGGPKQLLEDKMNFGDDPNSIVKYDGFIGTNAIYEVSTLPAAATLKNSYCTPPNAYDIIIITYNVTPNADQRQVLTDYVNAGGVFLYLDQNNSGTEGNNNAAMVGAIFGETMPAPTSIGSNCNHVIKMNSAINDEINNGVFGDVRSSQWGEDYANTCALTKIPRGAIVYSGVINAFTGVVVNTLNSNNAKVSMLRHPTKNFFWCGDSGLIDAPDSSGQSTNNTIAPFTLGSVTFNGITYLHFPVEKKGYGNYNSSTTMPVSNSIIFANLMAWALKMAEENGINSGR